MLLSAHTFSRCLGCESLKQYRWDLKLVCTFLRSPQMMRVRVIRRACRELASLSGASHRGLPPPWGGSNEIWSCSMDHRLGFVPGETWLDKSCSGLRPQGVFSLFPLGLGKGLLKVRVSGPTPGQSIARRIATHIPPALGAGAVTEGLDLPRGNGAWPTCRGGTGTIQYLRVTFVFDSSRPPHDDPFQPDPFITNSVSHT